MSQLSILEQLGIAVGVVAGVGGLVLGILNAVHLRSESRPRLRVRAKILHLVTRYAGPPNNNEIEKNVGVMEIANTGRLPVTGSTIGFLPKRGSTRGSIIVTPTPIDDGTWPRQIEPGKSCMLRMSVDSLLDDNPQVLGRAFVNSQIGDVFRATRGDTREFMKSLRKYQAEQDQDAAS